jgi:hypothetical protein
MNRRRRARLAVALLAATLAPVGVLGARFVAADGPRDSDSAAEFAKARRDAIRRGCDWLVTKQHQDGSFGEDRARVAFTALSTLALMAQGSGVHRGPYGESVSLGVQFLSRLVANKTKTDTPNDGFFTTPGDANSKMHGQGYATLCLASALGSASAETAPTMREVLRQAVACCEASQTGTGGWGYEPDSSGDHEGSVTVTVAQGLRASRDAGIVVNDARVRRALSYLRKSQKEDGSFRYSISTDRSTYALTAAAVSAFFLFGEYGNRRDPKDPLQRGIAYLKETLPSEMKRREWFYYGHFYAAWAAWQWDGDEPDGSGFWGPWHRAVYPVLLREQGNEGNWVDGQDRFNFGPVLPTAFAVLTLAIPDEQLPIFQR